MPFNDKFVIDNLNLSFFHFRIEKSDSIDAVLTNTVAIPPQISLGPEVDAELTSNGDYSGGIWVSIHNFETIHRCMRRFECSLGPRRC